MISASALAETFLSYAVLRKLCGIRFFYCKSENVSYLCSRYT